MTLCIHQLCISVHADLVFQVETMPHLQRRNSGIYMTESIFLLQFDSFSSLNLALLLSNSLLLLVISLQHLTLGVLHLSEIKVIQILFFDTLLTRKFI